MTLRLVRSISELWDGDHLPQPNLTLYEKNSSCYRKLATIIGGVAIKVADHYNYFDGVNSNRLAIIARPF